MKKNLIAIIIISFFCSRCKKSAPTPVLPAITETGANTFGCKVDGQIWVPYIPCDALPNGVLQFSYNIQPMHNTSFLPIFFVLSAGTSENGSSYFDIQQNFSQGDHIYAAGNVYDSLLIHFFGGPGADYQNYSSRPGPNAPRYFQINKLDTLNKIISGTFSFTLYAPVGINGLDSIVVTEGRFDLQMGGYARACSN
jgi:hypothetical protein